ncbi:hypothetical protein O5623_18480 [Escherichia coli]|nr:hypothetical protein [Escherichia coli]
MTFPPLFSYFYEESKDNEPLA